jgi:hypothetical protein
MVDSRRTHTVMVPLARADAMAPRIASSRSANRPADRGEGATQVLIVPTHAARSDRTAMLLAGVGLIGFVARRRQVGGRAP